MKEIIPMIVYSGLFLVVIGYVCFYLVLKEQKKAKKPKFRKPKKPKKQEKQKKEETKETVVVQQSERKKREVFGVIDVESLAEQSPFKEEEITEEQKQNEVIIIQNFEPLKYENEKEKHASEEKTEEDDVEEEIKKRLTYHSKKIDRTSPIQVEDQNKNELN